jgi:flavin-dependent dehydrogenase/Fe-S-cluster containining protein
MRNSRFLIVGAGPAGSAAAQVLARGGQEVILVESSRFDQLRVGELLSPEGQEPIKRLLPEQYKDFFLTKLGIVGAWYQKELNRMTPPSWWALDRLGLDRALAQAAVKAGAQLHLGCRVQRLERCDGHWNYQLEGRTGQADWLLIATGRSGQIARHVGAERHRFDRQVALVGFLEGEYKSSPDMLLESAPEGWWYGAPIDGTRAVAVFVTDSDLDKGEAQAAWLARLEESPQAKERFGEMTLVQKPSRVAAGFSVLVPNFGDGWVAVGEAASAFDPLSNLGVGRSAEAGEQLAHLFLEAAAAGREPDLLLAAERMGAEFKTHTGVLLDDYRKVHVFPNSVFWSRRVAGPSGDSVLRTKSRVGQPRKLLFAKDQRFECSQCGKCCSGSWEATVEISKKREVLDSEIVRSLSGKAGYKPLRLLKDGRLATNVDATGKCVFFQQDSSCGLYGEPSRPKSCDQFPFLLRDTPDGVVVSVSYYCQSVQRNEGRPLESYSEDIARLLTQRAVPALPRKFSVSWGKGVGWEECCAWEEFLLNADSVDAGCRALRWHLGCWLVTNQEPMDLQADVPVGPLRDLEGQMILYLLSYLENERFRTPKDIFEDLLSNRETRLWKVRWKGRLHDLLAKSKLHEVTWLHEEIDRYLRALVERKFLVLHNPFYHNLLIMAALPGILGCYSAVYAAVRESEQIEKEDYFKALDRVEMELTTYRRQDRIAQTFFFWHVAFLRETLWGEKKGP